MISKDRMSIIKQILLNDKKVVVSDLSSHFSVTEETIRRDLDKLETEKFITRTYGGAILNNVETASNIPFYKRAAYNIDAKKQIAITAQKVLENQHTMFADSSTTVMETIKLLKNRDDLTIVSNSAEMARELFISKVNSFSTGGMLNKKSLAYEGDLAEDAIRRYNTDVAVISCKGIDQETGVTDTNESQARLKKLMIKQAKTVMLLIDSSKFDSKAFVKLTDFNNITHIVTDKKPSDAWLKFFSTQGIELHFE